MRRLLPLLVALLLAPFGGTSAASSPPGQSAPVDTTPPSISGNAVQGQMLTAVPGSWSGPSPTFSYQWLHCSASGSSCTALSSAKSATYTLLAADVGWTIRVSVVATNKNGSTLATSAPTAPVAAPTSTTPVPTTTTSATSTTTPTSTATTTTTTPTTSTTTTTTTTATTTTSALPYFTGDPSLGSLTPWSWFNPGPGEIAVSTQPLGATSPGVVRAGSVGGAAAYQLTVTPTATASLASGSNAVWLWNNDHSYDYSGQTTWYHLRAYFSSSAFIPTTGQWNVFVEHHNDGGYVNYSCSREDANIDWRVTTDFPVVTNQVGTNPHLKMRVMGGPTCTPQTTWYDFGPLQRDHWYDILYQVVWSPNSTSGQVNAWVDGAQVAAYRGPTLFLRPDGSTSHTNFELVNYRMAANWNSTIYFGRTSVGPTRISVGG